jgi:hypothetical protein
MDATMGELSVLNVGAGDITVTFNKEDRGETAKALRMLKDMSARGYAIMVQLPDHSYVRAKAIDEHTASYVVVLPEDLPVSDAEVAAPAGTCACGCGGAVSPGKTWIRGHHHRRGRKGMRTARLPVRRSKAIGVARSAGG